MWTGSEWRWLKGKGCWYCPWETPVVRLPHVRICFSCLCRAFPGWSDHQVRQWLVHQVEKGARAPPISQTVIQLLLWANKREEDCNARE